MSDFTWTGSTGDGDHNNTGNWLAGIVPNSTGPHNITFDRGNYSMTTNIDAASVTYEIGTLTITAGFGGNIGSTSAAYTTASGKDIAKILCAGKGQYYKIGSGRNVGTSIANRCQIALSSGTTFVMSSGTWQFVAMNGGTLLAEAAAVVSTSCMLSGVTALLQTNATAVTLLEADNACDVTTNRNVTTANVNAQSTLRTVSAAAVTTANVTGSTWNMANTAAATHTTCNLRGGSDLNLDNATANQVLTNLYQWPGTAYTRNPAGVTLTVTNNYSIFIGSVGGQVVGG